MGFLPSLASLCCVTDWYYVLYLLLLTLLVEDAVRFVTNIHHSSPPVPILSVLLIDSRNREMEDLRAEPLYSSDNLELSHDGIDTGNLIILSIL